MTSPPSYSPQEPVGHLSITDRKTFEELARLDIQLAGLFAFGHELLRRISEPGVQYALAVVARELAVEYLQASGAHSLPIVPGTSPIPEQENHRGPISAALELPPDDSRVSAWLRLHQRFNEYSHYRQPPLPAEEIAEGFSDFSALLFGLVAPYFETHSELQKLALLTSVTNADVSQLQALLVRSVQRQYFFNSAVSSEWLAHLRNAGLFRSPPERRIAGDGSWRLTRWPEGDYLARMAREAPTEVCDALVEVPAENTNPMVWSAAVRASVSMDCANAQRLAPLVVRALRKVPAVIFPAESIPLIGHLAHCGAYEAFDIAEALLWPRFPEDTNYSAMEGGSGSRWLLARVSEHHFEDFEKRAVPALREMDGGKTVSLLIRSLARVACAAQRHEPGRDPGERLRGKVLSSRPLYGGDSLHSLAAILVDVAADAVRRNRAICEEIDDQLRKRKGELFVRVRLLLLAEMGAEIPDRLNEALSDIETVVDSPFGFAEIGLLLRRQFDAASPQVRESIRYGIERGPSPSNLQGAIQWANEPWSRESVLEAVAHWQRRRLRLFHDRLPTELAPLAHTLGFTPGIPDPQTQAIDEGRSFSSGVSWHGEKAPITSDALEAMGLSGIVEYLTTWAPTTGDFDGPTYRGLAASLSDLVARNPSLGVSLLSRATSPTMAWNADLAILSGLRRAAEEAKALPWSDIISALARQLDERNPQRREAIAEYIAVLTQGIRKSAIPSDLWESLWQIAMRTAAHPVDDAQAKKSDQPITSLSAFWSLSRNSLSGQATRFLVEVALWLYRLKTWPDSAKAGTEDGQDDIKQQFARQLDELRSRADSEGIVVQAEVGSLLPQIWVLHREWLGSRADGLLTDGARFPLVRPAWGMYVTHAPFYEEIFEFLEPFYLSAAEVAPDTNAVSEDDDWSMSRGLCVHVLVAVIRGLAPIGEEDSLSAITCARCSIADLRHAYWNLFRSFSEEHDESPGEELVGRVIAFWEWRIGLAEKTPNDTRSRAEADALGWFLLTPHLPADKVLYLGLRTLSLAEESSRSHGVYWERLAELSKEEPVAAFECVDFLVARELRRDHPYVPYEMVSEVLIAARRHGDATIDARVVRRVNELGARGHLKFQSVLTLD